MVRSEGAIEKEVAWWMELGACGWVDAMRFAMPELCGSLVLGKSNLCGWAQASAEGAALSTLRPLHVKRRGSALLICPVPPCPITARSGWVSTVENGNCAQLYRTKSMSHYSLRVFLASSSQLMPARYAVLSVRTTLRRPLCIEMLSKRLVAF